MYTVLAISLQRYQYTLLLYNRYDTICEALVVNAKLISQIEKNIFPTEISLNSFVFHDIFEAALFIVIYCSTSENELHLVWLLHSVTTESINSTKAHTIKTPYSGFFDFTKTCLESVGSLDLGNVHSCVEEF